MKRNPKGRKKIRNMGKSSQYEYIRHKEVILKDIIDCGPEVIENKPSSFEINIEPQYSFSKRALAGYVTLCWHHYKNIYSILDSITAYAMDKKRIRPLNIILQADPGSGKSHLIKCLAAPLLDFNIKAVTFNMASLQNLDEFIQPLDVVRNLKVNDELPLLFLDEFDTNERFISMLLPLLWDGELQVAKQNLTVGKIIIILAGSTENIEQAINSAKDMQEDISTEVPKLPDLLSRINGGELIIPSLDGRKTNQDRKVDKVCITISLLEKRFGRNLEKIPWALLHFISKCKFRFEVRSIAHLIDLIPTNAMPKNELKLIKLKLPLNSIKSFSESSLIFHIISKEGASAIVNDWKQVKKVKTMVNITKREKEKPKPEDPFFQFEWRWGDHHIGYKRERPIPPPIY